MNNKHPRLILRFLFAPSIFFLLTLLIWLSAAPILGSTFAQESEPVGGRGMTWASSFYFEDLNASYSRCYGLPETENGTTACNAYTGDTQCTVSLPVLCVLVDESPRPPYDPPPNEAGVMPDEYYRGWANGRIGATDPITGTLLTSPDVANDLCAAQLGDGYRMAEHHDGLWLSGMDSDTYHSETWPERSQLSEGGWGFFSYGQVPSDTRYWVHVDDQPANCWNSTPTALATIDEPIASNVAPQAPSSIAGRVTDENGTPLANIEVGLIPNGRFIPERTTTTANDGTYKFNLLGTGLYRLVFALAEESSNYQTEYYPGVDGLADAEPIYVASSDVEVEDVALTLGGAIAVTVRTTDEQLLSQVQILVSQNLSSTATPVLEEVRTKDFPSAYLSFATPVEIFSYEIRGLTAGLYRVCVTGKTHITYASAKDCYNQAGNDVEMGQDITVTQGITTTMDFQLTPETRYTISGTVTSPEGNPLPGIRVHSYISSTNSVDWYGGAETKTDEAGRYQIKGLRAGLYTLRFTGFDDPYIAQQYLGYTSDRMYAQSFTVGETAESSTIDFVPREYATISGMVTSASGQPLPGIRVGLVISATQYGITYHGSLAISFGREGIDWGETTTDENGQYRLQVRERYDSSPNAFYSLAFANLYDSYMDEYLGNSLSFANAMHIDVSPGNQLTGVDFVAQEGSTVTGRVTMEGTPVEIGFEIHMQKQVNGEWIEMLFRRRGDTSAVFQIQGLTPGLYKFAASAKIDGSDTRYFYGGKTEETATEVEIGLGDELQNIDIDIGADLFDGVLAGRVIYQGEPVENIQVEIDRYKNDSHSPVIELLTDADGRFRVEGVLPGSYCIRYVDPNGVYATNNYDGDRRCDRVHLEAGEQRTNLGHRLTLGGTISGQITNLGGPLTDSVEVIAYVNLPYAGRARWSNIGVTTIADADGRYTLSGLLFRTYRIGARYFSDENRPEASIFYGVSDTADKASDVRVSSGEEVANINMFFGSLEQLDQRSFLPFVVQADAVGRLFAQGQEPVSERDVVAKTIAPEAPSSIAGRVTDENGIPLPNVEVGLIANDGTRAGLTTTTASDGTYEFSSLGAGLYRIVFTPEQSSNYLTQYYPGVDELADAEQIFVASNDLQVEDFALTIGGSIVGTIRTTDEQPMQQVRFIVYQNEGTSTTPKLELARFEDQPVITPSNTISYSITGLTDGIYRICATGVISGTSRPVDDCYDEAGIGVETTQDITVTLGTTTTIDFLVMPETYYTISGTVISPSGNPLPSVKVTLYISSTTSLEWNAGGSIITDEAGRYQIERVRAGNYTLHFGDFENPYADQYLGYRSDPVNAQHFTVGEDAQSSTIDFVPRKYATISGVVTSPSGEPLPGILVGPAISTTQLSLLVDSPLAGFIGTVDWLGLGTTTNENGQYALRIKNANDLSQNEMYSLAFGNSYDQYMDEYLGNSLTFTNAMHIDVTPGNQLTGINFVAREGSTVTGLVTMEDIPIDSGFNVHAYKQINNDWLKVSSDWIKETAGIYQIQGLVPGIYKFSASTKINSIGIENFYGGKTVQSATEVEILLGDLVQNIDIDLGTGLFDGVLAGRVVFQGEPVEDIRVEIYSDINNSRVLMSELQTAADGRFRVEGVVQGSYCIRYIDPKGVYATSDYSGELIKGRCGRIGLYAGEQRTDLDHSLTLGGAISGQITDLDGPLTNPVEVIAFVKSATRSGWSNSVLTTMADEDGRYTLSGLPSGTYRIGARYLLSDNTLGSSAYYGLTDMVGDANDVRVASGEQVANINMLFGSLDQLEPRSFLPFLMQTN